MIASDPGSPIGPVSCARSRQTSSAHTRSVSKRVSLPGPSAEKRTRSVRFFASTAGAYPPAGPGVKETAGALGVDLLAAFSDNGLKGKRGEILTVPTLGRVPAKAVL